MYRDRCVLAVVPARSGSKGLPGKNMADLGGVSLIGRAGQCLGALPWLDRAVISTDDAGYAAEGERFGLSAPALRPAELASDAAGAVETVTHALQVAEDAFGERYDVVLIVEPTSPLRRPEDIEACVELLVDTGADSTLTVSMLSKKYNPRKVFALRSDGVVRFYEADGAAVVNRQELGDLYWRNGACYALTRACLLERRRVITDDSRAVVIGRELVNIDEPIELEWARFLLARENAGTVEEE